MRNKNQDSYNLSQRSNFLKSNESFKEQCHFCTGINLNKCMVISVFIIEKLVQKKHCASLIKYEELMKEIDSEEKMTMYYEKRKGNLQIKQLLQYYKYRKFVPLFADLKLGRVLHGYYYERLKLYYNQVKRKLNLTVDPSSETNLEDSQQLSVLKPFNKQNILNDLTQNLKLVQDYPLHNIQSFRTQSKALEDLVNFLKSNEKFKFIRPLNVQSQWQKQKKSSKQIFKDTILEQSCNNKKDLKKNKSKIFITFYSRQTPNDYKTNALSNNLNSQKLMKSKDVKMLSKQKQVKILKKLQKLKDQILCKKLNEKEVQRKAKNKEIMSKTQLIKKDQERGSLRMDKKIALQGRQTPKKVVHQQPKFNSLKQKLFNKPRIQKSNQKNQSPNQQKIILQLTKPRKSFSQSKLQKDIIRTTRSKSVKAISNKDVQNYVSSKKLIIEKEPHHIKNKQKEKRGEIESNKSGSGNGRRKSLDLTKMKSVLSGIEGKIQRQKKEDNLTYRYQRFIQQDIKMQIKTTNVSPSNQRSRNNEDEIVVERTDNIVSIKKKKLEQLKRKMELLRQEKQLK